MAPSTAYQATDPSKPAMVTLTITSTATLSLGGGTTIDADVVMGPTSGVATSGGTVVGRYKNSVTGTLVVGLGVNTAQTTVFSLCLPAGWHFAIRPVGGSMTVVSAYDQAVG